ncbi:hypothetical protein [Planktomarina sp.]|uniref:ADP-ribosyltransferase-containing protein n=1 Tax=Planktomarina sp. TaxID=2024851 RepID=UPI003260EFA9
MNIAEIREKYPQYNDLPDEKLLQGFHAKYYSDMDYSEFSAKVGARQEQAPQEQPQSYTNYATGLANAVGQGATFGFLDEAQAGLLATIGVNLPESMGGLPDDVTLSDAYRGIRDEIREKNDQFSKENPKTALAAEVAGGFMTGGLGAVKGAAAIGKAANAVKGTGKLANAARATIQGSTVPLLGAAEGAVYSAGASEADAFSSDFFDDMQTGATVGGATAGVLKGGFKLGSMFAENKAVKKLVGEMTPTIEGLKTQARTFYKGVKESKAALKPQAYQKLVQKVTARLEDQGYRPAQHAAIKTALDDMTSEVGGGVSFTTVDSLRKAIKDSSKELGSNSARLANEAVDEIDKFFDDLAPNMIGGQKPVYQGLDLSREARLARAKSQGFDTDTVYYHGTDADFNSFDPKKVGSNFGMDDDGFFFTTNASSADWSRGNHPNKGYNRLTDAERTKAASGQILPTYLKIDKPLRPKDIEGFDFDGGGHSPISLFDLNRDAIKSALKKGDYDSVAIKAEGSEMVMMLDNKNIKSQFSAFDPKQVNSGKLIDDIDQAVEQIVKESPDEIAHGYKEARQTWAKAKKAELIRDLFTGAEVQASGVENGMRTKMRQIYNNPRTRKLFTPEEQEAIKAVSNGTSIQNVLKGIGKFGVDTGHNGQSLLPALGAAFGGFNVLVPATIAKQFSNRMTVKNAKRLEQTILNGGDPKKVASIYVRALKPKDRNAKELAELFKNADPAKLQALQGQVKDKFVQDAIATALGVTSTAQISDK